MIIIITGASHTGKTVLAQRMLEKYKYPYLSIDHLKMGLIRSGNTDLTPCDDDKDLTDYLWPIVSEMIKTAIENKQNLIVEGCYVPSNWRSFFEIEKDTENKIENESECAAEDKPDYLSQIRFICLAMTDHYIESHFSDIKQHGSDIESRMDDSDCTVEWIKAENRNFINTFSSEDNHVVLIDDDYEKIIDSLL